jgi:starch-binding outer membrane protein, SusD/RagB family
MKGKFIYILVAFVAFGMFTSCKRELLNAAPENTISDASAFSNSARISNQVLSLYSALKNGAFYGGRYIVYGDIRGEEFLLEDPNLVTNADVWLLNPTNTANAIVGLWAQAYLVINNCNVFIDGMNEKGLTVVGGPLGNNYIAEARLIRAISYYSLLQYYARPYADGSGSKPGLPLRLVGIKGPGFSDMARSSVAEVYNQIISDLDFAETNLPSSYATSALAAANLNRAHKNTAIALKTRVYLSMQNYAKVIEEANKLVPASAPFTAKSGVAHTLLSDYTTIFKTYNNAESILSLPFTTGAGDIPGTQNGLQGYYYNASTGLGSIFSLNPAGIIGNTGWTTVDKRRSFIYTATSGTNAGKIYLTKYPTAAPADNSIVIRWAEVLLNLAEAKVRTTNSIDAQAVDLLNAIRNRSDATTTFTAGSFASAAELLNAIMTERRIEFLGEGLRNNDIMRLLQSIPAKGGVSAKAPSDQGYIWPVSAAEKSLNKLWVD